MLKSSTHNHTTFCDGQNTPEEMAKAAYALGFTDFGFSGHTYVDFADYGVKDELAYVRALTALREEYQGRMRIAIGLEHDYYYPVKQRNALDYIIGSVHELQDEGTGRRYPVDGPLPLALECKERVFHGDGLAMARQFYALTAENAERYRPEIIGHFDLIVKNNEDGLLFDEESPAYRAAALESLHRCHATGGIFELNTGGIFRGYRKTPYPADFLLRELAAIGGRVTVNGDAHTTSAINFWFSEALELLKASGFSTVWLWEDGGFHEHAIAEVE